MRVRAHQQLRYVQMRLKIIKQDGRMERPEAAGNEDWIHIGDVQDSVFSIIAWITRLFAFHARARDQDSPFFVDHDRTRCLTYSNAMRDVRALLARASSQDDAQKYGLHSLRVSGYNGAKHGKHGVTLAAAHGGWSSDAHERYARFDMSDVLALPSVIVQHNAQEGLTAGADELQRAPLLQPDAGGGILPRGPRPERPQRAGTGPRLGAKRRRQQPPANDILQHERSARVATDLKKGDRISVFWTEEEQWFPGTVLYRVRGTTFRIIYDSHQGFRSKQSRTFTHDLNEERWK